MGDIVGSFICRYPHDSDDNLGRDINLSSKDLAAVVHMESTVVSPEYRGRGIQKKMLTYAEALIDKNDYHYLMSTVSPNNIPSCRTFEKCGYVKKRQKRNTMD